ncbi:glycosyltransferase [Actomonas aquatica]|uniref:Glycosyltransferase n=1 Tax=Actomonas aquatica TaxID=2866162 RepID=A0ABZ1C9X5_9BACT|nr:glycosyltransferase [Opitutus sp. WL0086]WRQ88399.1 glycosyltransferase [Opitutus sp. WL0086]
MTIFCTYCDQGYAARMLCLHDSLATDGSPFKLYVLCMDEPTMRVVQAERSHSLIAISWQELKRADPDYAATEATRSPVEFIFTTTPAWVNHCFRLETEAEAVTYLDADLWFTGPFSEVLAQQGEASIGIVPHRFPARLKVREQYGIYNVAWVSFRRNEAGLACLAWWRERCIEWCEDAVDGERFADQGYLNSFGKLFSGVTVLESPGINAAPWNVREYKLQLNERQGLDIGGEPLLFYHFQGVREVAPGWFEPGLRAYGTELTDELHHWLYAPYLERLARRQAELRRFGIMPAFRNERLNTSRSWRDQWERVKRRYVLPWWGRLMQRLVHAPEPVQAFPILVVTPTLGDSPWLEETIDSVATQTMPCRHVLVCPPEKVSALRQRFPGTEVYPEPGGGMYAAINAGLAAAGEWGAFTYINDDDVLLPGFSKVAKAAQSGEAAVFYGGVRLINTRGERTGAIPISPWSRLNRRLYAQRVEPVYQHGTVFTRAVYDRIGGFDTDLKFCGDSEILARACVSGVRFRRASFGVVAAFRLRAGQLTKNLPVMLAEHHKLYDKHRLPAAKLGLSHRLARAVFLVGNLGVYLERIRRHGFIGFGEVLAKVE